MIKHKKIAFISLGGALLCAVTYLYSPVIFLKIFPVTPIEVTSPKSNLSEAEQIAISREMNRIAEGRTPDIVGTSTDIRNGWSLYVNKKFGVAFEYPNKELRPLEYHFLYRPENGAPERCGVNFAAYEGGPGIMGMTIMSKVDTSALGWVEKRRIMGSTTGSKLIIKKQVVIDNAQGIILENISPDEIGAPSKLQGQSAIFYKNGTTYEFHFRWMTDEEIERVWKSFRILDVKK